MSAAERGSRPGRTRQLAMGGISSALILLALAAAAFLPTADLSLFSLTSFFVAVVVIESGQALAWLVYAGAALLSLAWPGLGFSWPFLLFFGPYPLLRAAVDSRLGPLAARLFRLAGGMILLSAAVFLFARPAIIAWIARFGRAGLYLSLPLALLILFIYDLALGMLIRLYLTRLSPRRQDKNQPLS